MSGRYTTFRCSSSVRRRPGGKGLSGARICCFCSHGALSYRRKQATAPGHSPPPLTQSSVTPATPGAITSCPLVQQRIDGPQEADEVDRADLERDHERRETEIGATTNPGRISRTMGGEPLPVLVERRGSSVENILRTEGGGDKGEESVPGDVVQLRDFIADDQGGTTCGCCRAAIARGHRVLGLPCGCRHAMHAQYVVNAARRGGAQAPLLCGARG